MNDVKSTCWIFLFSGFLFGAGLSSYYYTLDWKTLIVTIIAGGLGLAYGYGGIFRANDLVSREVRRNSEMRTQIEGALHSSDDLEEIRAKIRIIILS